MNEKGKKEGRAKNERVLEIREKEITKGRYKREEEKENEN